MLSFNYRYFFSSLKIVTMLFDLLLPSITILWCFFFLFLIVFKSFFSNPPLTENVRPQLAPIIPASAPIAVAHDAIEILLVATDKTINDLSICSLVLFL